MTTTQPAPTPNSLTGRQRDLYHWFCTEILRNAAQPSYHETMRHFQIASPNGIKCHLRSLARKGFIRLRPPNSGQSLSHSRSVTILHWITGTPFLGLSPTTDPDAIPLKPLPPRAAEIYRIIFAATMKTAIQPSFRELCAYASLKSPNSINSIIRTLVRNHYIAPPRSDHHPATHARALKFLATPAGHAITGFRPTTTQDPPP